MLRYAGLCCGGDRGPHVLEGMCKDLHPRVVRPERFRARTMKSWFSCNFQGKMTYILCVWRGINCLCTDSSRIHPGILRGRGRAVPRIRRSLPRSLEETRYGQTVVQVVISIVFEAIVFTKLWSAARTRVSGKRYTRVAAAARAQDVSKLFCHDINASGYTHDKPQRFSRLVASSRAQLVAASAFTAYNRWRREPAHPNRQSFF